MGGVGEGDKIIPLRFVLTNGLQRYESCVDGVRGGALRNRYHGAGAQSELIRAKGRNARWRDAASEIRKSRLLPPCTPWARKEEAGENVWWVAVRYMA